jgi:thymidine phosphorylase
MLPQEIIATKRDGGTLDDASIGAFVEGLTDGGWSEGQVAALAMAVLLRGMTTGERAFLTTAMRDSGRVLEWDLAGSIVDKHSTGGVGDTVSLLLAPALAACGAFVPMISGRGLGHTGGTLDKLETIPGYRATPGLDELQRVVTETGCAIVGQTDEIAPADRRLYAVRDISATVESVDLITASILSKKLAAGLDALVLDVKTGSGAFMRSADEARTLARALVEVAEAAGCRCSALLTEMDQPLASAAGNALEVALAVRVLRGDEAGEARLVEVSCALGGELLALAGIAGTASEGETRVRRALESGAAAERFGRMVAALGGPADFVERFEEHLPEAGVVREVLPAQAGRVQAIDTRALGWAVVEMGGGRRRAEDPIHPGVGLSGLAGLGEEVGPERPLGRLHLRGAGDEEAAAARVRAAYRIGEESGALPPLVRERVGGGA